MLVWLRFLALVFCGAVTVKLVGLVHHWRKLWVAMGLRSTPGVRKIKGVVNACTRLWLGNDPRNHRHRVYYTYALDPWTVAALPCARVLTRCPCVPYLTIVRPRRFTNGPCMFHLSLIAAAIIGLYQPFVLSYTIVSCVPMFPILMDFLMVLKEQWRPLLSALLGALVSLFGFAVLAYVAAHRRCRSRC